MKSSWEVHTDLINGVGIGIQYIHDEEDEAWLFEFLFFRLMFYREG